jgi:hypothetical protein
MFATQRFRMQTISRQENLNFILAAHVTWRPSSSIGCRAGFGSGALKG